MILTATHCIIFAENRKKERITMPNVTVVAKVVAKKECVENVKIELQKLVEPTRKELGCIEYLLHQDCDDPAIFVFYETWESLNSLEKHMCTEHFSSYVNAVDGMLEEKVVHKMVRVEPR